MTSSDDQEPKIIVDDDWKTQVQAEKEELLKKEAEEASASNDDQTDATQTESGEPQELPPASLTMLVTTLSAQAMTSLGFIPDPTTGKSTPNRPLAKHFIDTLGVLEEKTNGNLTTEEANLLKETLHQLRMAFITPPQSE